MGVDDCPDERGVGVFLVTPRSSRALSVVLLVGGGVCLVAGVALLGGVGWALVAAGVLLVAGELLVGR